MAMLLLHRDATVTICHSRTPDCPRFVVRPISSLPPSERGTGHERLCEAGRDGDRRWDESRHGSGGRRAAVFRRAPQTASFHARAPCSSAMSIDGRRSGGRPDPRARRRRTADDHDADDEHAARGAGARGGGPTCALAARAFRRPGASCFRALSVGPDRVVRAANLFSVESCALMRCLA